MFAPRLRSLKSVSKACLRFSTQGLQPRDQGSVPQTSNRLQFSKGKLTEFGELPQGEVPEALRYDRPLNQTQLSNGLRVVTEKWNSPLTSITVAIKAGTRYETLENSGVSLFLERLNQRGTSTHTREQIEAAIDKFGGVFSTNTTRELQTYTLSFLPQQIDEAVAFLGDILSNSLYNPSQVEIEKDSLYRSAVDQKDQHKTVIEAAHYTSFRDHYMGQPVTGIRENLVNITADHIKDYHKRHFVGHNVIVSGAGNIDHEKFLGTVQKSFGHLSGQVSLALPNSEKPYFTPSIMSMRDDEQANLNVGVFFDVPSWDSPDCLPLHFFKHIVGDYRADKYTGAHLNNSDRQYNQMHAMLGDLPDVTIQKCHYIGYSDSALFGNYLMGNEVFATQLSFVSQMVLSEYASYVNPVEVFRARAKIFNNLLSAEDSAQVSKAMALQTNYWGRRMPRSEFARRISSFDAGHLMRVATRVFWDREISVVLWGPTHLLAGIAHYNRPWKRSTLGGYAYAYYQG